MDETISSVDSEKLQSVLNAVAHFESADAAFDKRARIVILRNLTIEGIEPFLKFHLYTAGLAPSIAFGGYDTVRQDLTGLSPELWGETPDLIVLALMLEHLDPTSRFPRWEGGTVKEDLAAIFEMASRHSSLVAINTFAPPFHPQFGIAAPPEGISTESVIADLNRFIRDYAQKNSSQFVLMDWERYLRITGEREGIDHRYWYLARAPFRPRFLSIYARELASAMRALKGKAKKCVVLDCDNTLWGGIVGEDGPNGIKLDRNDYPGKAFYDFQTSLLHLLERGVLLTLCSKNNETDVMEILDQHPHCLLKREHLAARRINWEDKATNILSLAEELNLGTDSFVFVDDNPYECELALRLIPEITVLQVPKQLHTYPPLLLKDGLFDTLAVSREDRLRTSMYRQESERKSLKTSSASLESYLDSLEMVATIGRMLPEEISRTAQLTQKTNQFNLTSRRYSEADISRFAAASDSAVITLSVTDRFGDLGLVGVLIAHKTPEAAEIDSLLLSCRVLGRDLEIAFVCYCLNALEKEWGVSCWSATFLPTQKNQQVAFFWEKIGFAATTRPDGSKSYSQMSCSDRVVPKQYIRIMGR